MSTRSFATFAAVAALGVGVAACGSDNSSDNESSSNQPQQSQQANQGGTKSVVVLAKDTPDLKTLATAVTAAGLAKTLDGKGPYTVFAPTNQAFAQVPKSQLTKLLSPAGRQQLTSILTYHVVPGKLEASQLKNGQELKTVEGQKLRVKVQGGSVTVGGAKVVKADVQARNGVVHVIDGVLVPPQSS